MTDGRREVFAAANVCSLRCGGARAAALTAGDAAFSAVQAEWTMLVPAVLSYRPGEFFLREPPLRTVLARVRNLGLLVIDGYADLDPGSRPGLGAHAYAAFGVPVIDVGQDLVARGQPRGSARRATAGQARHNNQKEIAPRLR